MMRMPLARPRRRRGTTSVKIEKAAGVSVASPTATKIRHTSSPTKPTRPQAAVIALHSAMPTAMIVTAASGRRHDPAASRPPHPMADLNEADSARSFAWTQSAPPALNDGIGSASLVTLAEACEAAHLLRKLARSGARSVRAIEELRGHVIPSASGVRRSQGRPGQTAEGPQGREQPFAACGIGSHAGEADSEGSAGKLLIPPVVGLVSIELSPKTVS